MDAAPSAADLHVPGKEQHNRGDREDDTDHRKSITEAQDERLATNQGADDGDGFLLRDERVRHAMHHEMACQVIDPGTHLLAVERDGLADDVQVELLALAFPIA